jgi:hypothetical protein
MLMLKRYDEALSSRSQMISAEKRCVIAIMQPTFLPWAGYFDLINSVDQFVFLDSVQIEKQSWQTRNRILINGKEHILSVPMDRETMRGPLLSACAQPREHWFSKMRTTLLQAYAFSPFRNDVITAFDAAYGEGDLSIERMNRIFISVFCQLLNIQTPLLKASDLGSQGVRSDRLIAICHSLNAQIYLSPRGSAEYLEQDGFTRHGGPNLVFQNFAPKPYQQKRTSTFISHLSIVDVYCHLGPDQTRAYIGMRP